MVVKVVVVGVWTVSWPQHRGSVVRTLSATPSLPRAPSVAGTHPRIWLPPLLDLTAVPDKKTTHERPQECRTLSMSRLNSGSKGPE